MVSVNDAVKHIQSLDPDACVCFSSYTQQWYVSAHIHVVREGTLETSSEHRDIPEEAVLAFFSYLIVIGPPHAITTNTREPRPLYRWDRGCFREVSDQQDRDKVRQVWVESDELMPDDTLLAVNFDRNLFRVARKQEVVESPRRLWIFPHELQVGDVIEITSIGPGPNSKIFVRRQRR